MSSQARKGNPGQRARAGESGQLPEGSSIGTDLKRWIDIQAGRREKRILGKGVSMSKGPEVGQVEE